MNVRVGVGVSVGVGVLVGVIVGVGEKGGVGVWVWVAVAVGVSVGPNKPRGLDDSPPNTRKYRTPHPTNPAMTDMITINQGERCLMGCEGAAVPTGCAPADGATAGYACSGG